MSARGRQDKDGRGRSRRDTSSRCRAGSWGSRYPLGALSASQLAPERHVGLLGETSTTKPERRSAPTRTKFGVGEWRLHSRWMLSGLSLSCATGSRDVDSPRAQPITSRVRGTGVTSDEQTNGIDTAFELFWRLARTARGGTPGGSVRACTVPFSGIAA